MMPATLYPHMEAEPDGTLFIAGTRFKVIMLLTECRAYNWDAQELKRQHPQLSLAQIHSILAYYYDNQAEVDRQIEDRARSADELLAKLPETPAHRKLRKIGSSSSG